MKVGTALNMLYEPGRPDVAVVQEHFHMGDLVEPLGFDSLWALEHHFTGYAMSPAPTQLLAYFAGRTKRISLGTSVIVLPWHDPIRVAEQIALLDIMCGGRCLFGFGRGAATTEYEGFRVPMGEARPRFVEAAQIVVKALRDEVFEHQGEFFKIPKMSIRPRPMSNPERRFYASSVSPESAEVIAKLGFGMLMIMQNEWAKCRQDIETFQSMSAAAGHVPKPPVILTNVSCAESREEARERAIKYLGRKWQSIDDHYHFSDGHLANVKGYEAYGKTAKTYAKLKDPANLKKATDFYVSIQIVGTPDDCLQQIAELHKVAGMEHLIAEFSFGNLPHHEAEKNIRLFADKCLPVLQRDPLYAVPKSVSASAATPSPQQSSTDGIFAPA
jgi:alkanesulfonate monooxygenase SsuD/methylene tetrahydromethanopterin reductase-like flavin-dependent oxidoreductase (luciferase family)